MFWCVQAKPLYVPIPPHSASSFDGNNGEIHAFINDTYDNGRNAYNWGPSGNATILAFGADTEYHNSIDVVGHELTHALQRSLVPGFLYQGESGALMEAYSDLGGELAQKYTTGSVDWMHGTSRNVKSPGDTWNPKKYGGWLWGDPLDTYDHGYVHNNSTVISHAVYEMYKSGLNDTVELTELLFRTWHYLSPSANFVEYRSAMMAAANDMGLSTTKKGYISDAFDDADVKVKHLDQFWFATSGDYFHIYYGHQNAVEPDGTVTANLDIDDTNGYGPETVTIQWIPGVEYTYYIHLYAGNGTISTSGAAIQIYSGSTLLYNIQVPSGSEDMRIWNVFTFKDGTVNFINTLQKAFADNHQPRHPNR